MRRNWRPFVSRACRGGGPAFTRARGLALRFGKGNRRARHDRPGGISLRETADRRIAVAIFAQRFRFLWPLRRKPPGLPRHLPQFQAARRARDGWVYFHRARHGRKNAWRANVYPRIQCHPRQGKPDDGTDGPCGFAWLQGMRPVFSESADGSDRHADPERASADGPEAGPPETRFARRPADGPGDGRQPGRERDQPGDDQGAPAPARDGVSGDSSRRNAGRAARGR